MKCLEGKDEIILLLSKVVEKFESSTNNVIIKNSNKRNYEGLAIELSTISNELPKTSELLGHDFYPIDHNPKGLLFPFRKYDITGNQIRDAYYNKIVSHPRPYLVDACYIYLYGVGRKRFIENPLDNDFLLSDEIRSEAVLMTNNKADQSSSYLKIKKSLFYGIISLSCFSLLALLYLIMNNRVSNDKENKNTPYDDQIVQYIPTIREIDSLEGIWKVFIGSPQARMSDPNRYHQVVYNIVEIKYNGTNFIINRYGANFNHIGYAEYEAPGLVSLHTFVKNKNNKIESPRHSLMRINKDSLFKSVLSVSWNFDVEKYNDIIGIREVYTKLGKGGKLEEVINTTENASCKCKILVWEDKNNNVQKKFYLRNTKLEEIEDKEVANLIDENSILSRTPLNDMVIK
jgi:hypothetical protein